MPKVAYPLRIEKDLKQALEKMKPVVDRSINYLINEAIRDWPNLLPYLKEIKK